MSSLKNVILNSLYASQHLSYPFSHWVFKDFLSDDFCRKIFNYLSIEPTQIVYDGTRAGDNYSTAYNQNRVFLTNAIVAQYSFLEELLTAMSSEEMVKQISTLFSTNLTDCFLRIEYIEDKNGFYLKPHQDISEKKLTIFVYLGDALQEWGTDFYDGGKKWVKTIPFVHNTGYIFVPGRDTWHGFEKKKIEGKRKALLINYVSFPTDWKLLSGF
jgi:hypothetical protein